MKKFAALFTALVWTCAALGQQAPILADQTSGKVVRPTASTVFGNADNATAIASGLGFGSSGFPAITGQSGKVLSTDGSLLQWITAGAGTVTSFSAGDLSPLFTTSEATATTTPALSFTLSTQAANRIFAGPATGADAAPTFRALVDADIPATLTGKSVNGVTLAGSGTLDIGPAGTLGTAAFTAATAYATAAQGTKADNVGAVNGIVKSNGSATFSAAVAGTDYLAPTGSGASLTNVVNSITGTAGEITASAATGAVTLSLPTSLTSIDNITASSATNMVLTAGSSGASLTLGQGANGSVASLAPFMSGAVVTAQSARFLALESVTEHAHYGFIDLGTTNFTVPGTYGRASFAAYPTIGGTTAIDHHNSYQSNPTYSGSGTIGYIGGFRSAPIVSSGTATDLYHVLILDTSGAGSVGTQYGARFEELTKGSSNYAVYTAGATPSYFGGYVGLGITSGGTRLHVKGTNDIGGGITLENTAGPNIWRVLPSTPGISNTGLAIVDRTSGSDVTRAQFTTTGNLLIGGTTDITGSGGLKVFGTTAATSTTTGALQVAGGVGVGGAINAGGSITSSKAFRGATVAVSGTDIDWSQGNHFTKTLSANTTFTFSNLPPSGMAQTIVVEITNTASNYTVTWPSATWTGGVQPTQTTGAKTDIWTFIHNGTATVTRGSVVQNH